MSNKIFIYFLNLIRCKSKNIFVILFYYFILFFFSNQILVSDGAFIFFSYGFNLISGSNLLLC